MQIWITCTEYCLIEDYNFIDYNLSTEGNTLRKSDMVNCNEDNLSEEVIEQPDEEYESKYIPTYKKVLKIINNFKLYIKNKQVQEGYQ